MTAAPSPTPTVTPALELRDVTAGYGSTIVLRNLSLTVPAASVVALLGPNGAGKTTTLRAISGLVAVRDGRVLLGGQDMTRAPVHVRTRQSLCMIPEGRGIFPTLTVHENLRLQALGIGRRDGAVERALELFPALAPRLRQVAGTMSGGQQQMLALARITVTGARVILLDEVSMGLSPAMVDQIFEALRRVAAQGTALLIVEQYVARALELADEVLLMTKGTVLLRATADQLTEDLISEHYLGGGSRPAPVRASGQP